MTVDSRPEVSQPTELCPEPHLWRMWDDDTAECEVLLFLGALVRLLKPHLVVETGTNIGYSAAAMGEALVQNGRGRLDTFETESDRVAMAAERCKDLPVINIIHGSSLDADYSSSEAIDLLYCDSDLGIRCREVQRFKPWLSKRHVIVVHDTSPARPAPRDELEQMEQQGDIRIVYLPTPRGIAICQLK